MARQQSIVAAAASGDRRVVLEATRAKLAACLQAAVKPLDVATLAKQLAAVVAEIDSLPTPTEMSQLDALAARRSARRSNSPGVDGPAVSV